MGKPGYDFYVDKGAAAYIKWTEEAIKKGAAEIVRLGLNKPLERKYYKNTYTTLEEMQQANPEYFI